jgi:lipopolysaccharide/colanic/teichoic acid biosynthesis glycosyltransferase
MTPVSNIYRFIKRTGDILLSLLALIGLSWLFLTVAIAIRATSPGPAVFKQQRVGKDGTVFTMYKFRSMVRDAEKKQEELIHMNIRNGPAFKIADDPRVTTVGRFIRHTSIDELPQLLNIIKGEMSIVGPRPSLPDETLHYSAYQHQRFDIKPGLTCYWQINHNSQTTFDEWIDMDLRYIRDRSLATDTKLIVATISLILFHTKTL